MKNFRVNKWLLIGGLSVIALGELSVVGSARFAAVAEARRKADRTGCYVNMRQMTMGMQMYFNEHGEMFSLTPLAYKNTVKPSICLLLNTKVSFHCPADKSGADSYSYNTNLNGHTIAETNLNTVMVYEGKNGHLDFRHDGSALVGFADGHTEAVSASRAGQLRWKP